LVDAASYRYSLSEQNAIYLCPVMKSSPFQPNYYLDFHTHKMRHDDRDDIVEIVSVHPGKGHPHRFYTIGYHPWWIDQPLSTEQHQKLSVELVKPDCLALGEVGLDNLKGPPIGIQMDILRSQLPLAVAHNKPVIIHCVRAFDQLIQIKKEFPSIKRWCIHGYGRHAILARQLVDQGFYLSLMPGLPEEKYAELLNNVPLERIFLETDSMPDCSIDQIYSSIAALINMEVSDLCRRMNENAQTFFCA
jgi:TatD DNase family protein